MSIYSINLPEDIKNAYISAEHSAEHMIVLRFSTNILCYPYTDVNSLVYRFVRIMNATGKTYCFEAELPRDFTVGHISRIYCLLSICDEYAVIDQRLSKIFICSDISVANYLLKADISKSRELKQDTVENAVAILTEHSAIDSGIRNIYNAVSYCENKTSDNTIDFYYKVKSMDKYTAFALDNFNQIVTSIDDNNYLLHWHIIIEPWVFRYKVENTRIGWEKAWMLRKKHNRRTNIDYWVEIPTDKSFETSDVTNLKYMYPILEALHDRCFVHIKYDDLSGENNEKFRLNAFLY